MQAVAGNVTEQVDHGRRRPAFDHFANKVVQFLLAASGKPFDVFGTVARDGHGGIDPGKDRRVGHQAALDAAVGVDHDVEAVVVHVPKVIPGELLLIVDAGPEDTVPAVAVQMTQMPVQAVLFVVGNILQHIEVLAAVIGIEGNTATTRLLARHEEVEGQGDASA